MARVHHSALLAAASAGATSDLVRGSGRVKKGHPALHHTEDEAAWARWPGRVEGGERKRNDAVEGGERNDCKKYLCTRCLLEVLEDFRAFPENSGTIEQNRCLVGFFLTFSTISEKFERRRVHKYSFLQQ